MDRNLRAFIAVVEAGNITAAANLLHITQPTLTKRLQHLEEEYGCALFERLPRGVRVTSYGEALLPYARRVQAEFLQASEAVNAIKTGHLNDLRIGAGPLFYMRYLGGILRALHEEFPDTALKLTADVNRNNLPGLKDGTLDIVFGTTEHLAPKSQIEFHHLTTVEHGIVLRHDHSLAQDDRVPIEKLSDVPWVVYGQTDESVELVRSWFRVNGIKQPEVVLFTTSLSMGFQFLAGGDFVMSVPVQIEPVVDRLKLRVLRTAPAIGRLSAGAFVRRSSVSYPIVRRLLDISRHSIKD